MPFWLHESRIIHILRELTPRTQVLIALCCVLGAVCSVVAYQQMTCPVLMQPNKNLQKVLNHPKILSSKMPAHYTQSAALDLRTLPQTLQFFTQSGFHVKRIEKLVRPRSRQLVGYVICVQGSFEVLIKFLTALKKVPAFRLRLQQIDRVSDAKLEIEFFMQGARG